MTVDIPLDTEQIQMLIEALDDAIAEGGVEQESHLELLNRMHAFYDKANRRTSDDDCDDGLDRRTAQPVE